MLFDCSIFPVTAITGPTVLPESENFAKNFAIFIYGKNIGYSSLLELTIIQEFFLLIFNPRLIVLDNTNQLVWYSKHIFHLINFPIYYIEVVKILFTSRNIQGVPENTSHFVVAYISASWADTAKLLYFFMMACPCRCQICPWINSNVHFRPRYSLKSALQAI